MKNTRILTRCAVLTALALALSYTERFIPLQLIVPLPGVKIGLANIVTLAALYFLDTRYAFAILICRCVFGAVFGGGITGLAFSLTGGIGAMCVMALAKHSRHLSVYGVSLLGAAAHNIGQILAAMVLLGSPYVAGYLPVLLLFGIVTGLFTGAVSAGLFRALRASGAV